MLDELENKHPNYVTELLHVYYSGVQNSRCLVNYDLFVLVSDYAISLRLEISLQNLKALTGYVREEPAVSCK